MEIGPDRLYGITGHNHEPEAHRNRSLPALSLSLSLWHLRISQDLSQTAFPTLIYFTNVKHYRFPGASPLSK